MRQAWGTTLLRVTVGAIYVAHGYLALAVIGPGAAGDLIVGVGYPESLALALAWYLIAAQGGGGVLLVLGLWTRTAALLQVPVMLTAVFLTHWPQGFFMHGASVATAAGTRLVAAGYEYSLLLLSATLALALLGAGRLSLDRARDRAGRRRMP